MNARAVMIIGGGLALTACVAIAQDRLSFRRAGQVLPSSNERIERVLNSRYDADFAEQPLSQVLNQLENTVGVPIFVDQRRLANEGISVERPVTLKVKGRALRSVLQLMLSEASLSYVKNSGRIVITTASKANSAFIQRDYEVADFASDASRDADLKALSTAIKRSVRTGWSETGEGDGSIEINHDAGILHISQTQSAHREIKDLLAALRRASRSRPPARIP